MIPYDPQHRDLLRGCNPIWKWKNTDPGETAIESLKIAWKNLTGTTLPELPEAYDLGEGELLYFLPPKRFIKVHVKLSKTDIEIWERMPLYYLRALVYGRNPGRPRFVENYPTDQIAVYSLGLQAKAEGIDDGFIVIRNDIDESNHETIFTWSLPWNLTS
jgi:hypothetical protein